MTRIGKLMRWLRRKVTGGITVAEAEAHLAALHPNIEIEPREVTDATDQHPA